ncbi:hypothetical protein LZ30DRAFT_451324 [Colletotrichum cereale]|nr:hypothetical protein LZ30DRAFT_451324 [Colletotrichum cereale]
MVVSRNKRSLLVHLPPLLYILVCVCVPLECQSLVFASAVVVVVVVTFYPVTELNLPTLTPSPPSSAGADLDRLPASTPMNRLHAGECAPAPSPPERDGHGRRRSIAWDELFLPRHAPSCGLRISP